MNVVRAIFAILFFAISITAWLVVDSTEGFIIALFASAYFCEKIEP